MSLYEQEQRVLNEQINQLLSKKIDVVYLSEIKNIRFTPNKIIDIFEEWGYDCDYLDEHGWEQDTEYIIANEDVCFIMSYSGYYFTIELRIYNGEDE